MDKYDLENRLIAFAVDLINCMQQFKNLYVSQHLSNQLVRSGTSVALNYAEAQSAESRRDFIHKMKICQKELRETHFCLKIILQAKLHLNPKHIEILEKETNELISIFVSSVRTAKAKM